MYHHPIRGVVDLVEASVLLPFLKIGQSVIHTGWLGKLLAAGAGVSVFIRSDLFLITVCLYTAVAAADWFVGRRLAHRLGEFDPDVAKFKLGLKAMLLIQLSLVWSLGNAVVGYFGGDWGGMVAATLMAFVVIDELDSVETNRVALGGRPVPGWTHAIAVLRGASDRFGLLRGDDRRIGDRERRQDTPPRGKERQS